MAGTGWDPAGVDTEVTISPDGQTATRSGDSTYSAVRGLAGRSRGRRYFEITPGAVTFASYCAAGFMSAGASLTQELGIGTPIAGGWKPEQGVFKYSYASGSGAREEQDNVSAGALGVLIDFDTKVCTIYRNGVVDWVEVMDIPDDTVLYPAASLYTNTSVALQTVEPFQYPPEVTYMSWDIPDSAILSKVSGLMKIEGAPVRRTLKAFSFERMTYQLDGFSITESKPLGQTLSGENGEYQIILRDGFPREVFVVAFDDYGERFRGGLSVTPGYRVHPTVPNGLVYECDGSGVLPALEPAWSTNTETSQLVGTASFKAVIFYRPEVHGPLVPTITNAVPDPHWNQVVSLLHFEGGLADETGRQWMPSGNIVFGYEVDGFGSQIDLSGGAIYTEQDGMIPRTDHFTIEMLFKAKENMGPSSDQRVFLSEWGQNERYSFLIDYYRGTLRALIATSSTSSTPARTLSHAVTFPFGSTNRIAFQRDSTGLSLFVEGLKVATAADYALPIYPYPTYLGAKVGLDETKTRLRGFVDEVRITSGLARLSDGYVPADGPFPSFGS